MFFTIIGPSKSEYYFIKNLIIDTITKMGIRRNDTILVKEDTELSKLCIDCAREIKRQYTDIRMVAVLFMGQEEMRRTNRRSIYDEVITLPERYQEKDKWMIDMADVVLSCFDENEKNNETYLYAKSTGKKMIDVIQA